MTHYLLAIATLTLIVGLPIFHWVDQRRTTRNFRTVESGVIYRSGQMTPEGLSRILDEYQIRTVISLRDARDPSKPAPDEFEQDLCRSRGIQYHRLTPLKWSEPEGTVPAEANVQKFVEWLRDPATPRPILIHCFAGVHRTGAFVAITRMEMNGWSNDDAVREMLRVAGPRETFEADQIGFLRTYRPKKLPIK